MRKALTIALIISVVSSCRLSPPDCDDPTFLRITQDVATFGVTELYRAAALDCPPTTESLLERTSELLDGGDAAERFEVGRTLWYREEFDLGYSLVCLSAHQRHQDAQEWLAGRYQYGWLGRRHYPGLSPREVDYVEAYKWYSIAFYGADTGCRPERFREKSNVSGRDLGGLK
jgi:hypothetical protein